MMMPSNMFSSAFRRQRLGLMFSVIMLVMVFIGSLMMAGQVTVVRTAFSWGYDLQSRLTVEIPSIPDEVSNVRQNRAESVATLLRDMPEIASVTIVPDSETKGLLGPWIKDPALLVALPLPTLIDIDLKLGASLDEGRLSSVLSATAQGILVHSHAGWMDTLLGFLTGLGVLASVLLILTACALVASICVICRAAMAVQHETIELLHYMGATDKAIAQQFQRHIQTLAIPAAFAGFVLAGLTVLGLAALWGALGGLSLIAALSWVTVAMVMGCVPIGAILLAVITARLSVQKYLRHLA